MHAFDVASWLESRGHEVVPFAMREDGTVENRYVEYFPPEVDFRGSTVTESRRGIARAVRSADSRAALRALIRAENPDAAYVLHIYHQLGTALLNELHSHNIPTVLSLHDYKIACPNYRFFSEKTGEICTKCLTGRAGYTYNPAIEKCWNGSAAAGLALSVEASVTKIRRSYQQPGAVTILNSLQHRSALHAGVDADRLLRVPHAVNLEAPRTMPGPGARFLYLGRLVPEKGVEVLIRAAARAQVPLTIAGDGRSQYELEVLVKELDADVQFVGAVPRERVRELLRGSRALIVPSVWHEVSPLVVLEAIANDVPVIATAVGGMVDQLENDRGYLVPPNDDFALAETLVTVADDPVAAQDRSTRARAHALQEWSSAQWEQNMEKAFRIAGVQV